MKYTMFFTALAAMIVTVSCQKENIDSVNEELVFTASIVDSQTKTTINTDSTDVDNRGKISWEKGDQITITDASAKSAVYVAASAGQTVNFTKKSGEPDLGAGPYTATYGTVLSTTQNYSDYYSKGNEAKNLYMEAPSTETKSLTFTAACGLLRLNLTAAGSETTKNIKKIEIMGTPDGGTTATIYTLNCSPVEDISSANVFYLALPKGSYSVMKFTNSIGRICIKTAKTAMAISNNTIQPTTISNIEFTDKLSGKFSVASDKQVRFSKGNMYYDGSTYKFEDNQYSSATSWSSSHVSHFFWIKNNEKTVHPYDEIYGTPNPENQASNIFFTNASAYMPNTEFNCNGATGVWRTLSNDEWAYLFGTEGGRNDMYRDKVTVAGKANCVVLYPDGYEGTKVATSGTISAADWAVAESVGVVCLPAAGRRLNSTISDAGSKGNYWSSKANAKNEAYNLYFSSYGVSRDDDNNTRSNGYSVRLVCAAQ